MDDGAGVCRRRCCSHDGSGGVVVVASAVVLDAEAATSPVLLLFFCPFALMIFFLFVSFFPSMFILEEEKSIYPLSFLHPRGRSRCCCCFLSGVYIPPFHNFRFFYILSFYFFLHFNDTIYTPTQISMDGLTDSDGGKTDWWIDCSGFPFFELVGGWVGFQQVGI